MAYGARKKEIRGKNERTSKKKKNRERELNKNKRDFNKEQYNPMCSAS